ncbi:MAG: metallophosphoesterase [Erysipelotrichaceae bacterium]|nr:MAG: hypothetical protein FD179_107 [Erysipelotrichaceae bacterium]TXT18285.1 MAG: metallophosphoesterase [Erysipelotrichaceae bacterium]
MQFQFNYFTLVWIIVALLISGILIVGTIPNSKITITSYEITSTKISEAFDGYVIVQVSDLHNKSFGKNQERLIQAIKTQNPDLIVLTGDMVGSWDPKYDHSLVLIKEALKIAPVIIVDGNHDARIKTYPIQKQAMIDAGGLVLEDESLLITKQDSSINLIGLKERFFVEDRGIYVSDKVIPNLFNLLLAHHPNNFDDYVRLGVDVVLVGHAHGGQWRFFGQGLYTPNEGILPKYTAGSFSKDTTTMIISRGLGESVLPLRLFNGPELVVITLKK